MKKFLVWALSVASFALGYLGIPLPGCAASPEMTRIAPSLLLAIKDAKDQARSFGSSIWPGYETAPFGLLATLEGREVLFCHGSLVAGFTALPPDPDTRCDLQERPNVFPRNLLAAMPVIEGISTIVMGTPESTGRDQVDWTQTIFHEHFHQYQSGFDNYYQRLNGLDLDGGDDTGMWMLNYPFPYREEQFELALSRAAQQLHDAINQHGTSFQEQVSIYLKARQALEAAVPAEDWRYLELQLWMEGVARWTEIEIALGSSNSGVVASGRALRQRTVSSLPGLDAAQLGRALVYPYGATEAMLLERCKPTWRQGYPAVLSLGALVKAIEPDNCR